MTTIQAIVDISNIYSYLKIWYFYIPIWFPCRFWAFETLAVGVYHNSFIVSLNVARFLVIKDLSYWKKTNIFKNVFLHIIFI